MKKLILFSVVIFMVFGFKNKDGVFNPPRISSVSDCITLADYDKLKLNTEKAAWLVANGRNVCVDILYAREIIHEVTSGVEIPVDAKPYPMDWDVFLQLIGTTFYEKYVGFEVDVYNNVTKVVMVPKYLEKGVTYSAPLFRSIGIKYQFTDKKKLEFVKALVKGKSEIVIRFTNAAGDFVYYDYCGDPL